MFVAEKIFFFDRDNVFKVLKRRCACQIGQELRDIDITSALSSFFEFNLLFLFLSFILDSICELGSEHFLCSHFCFELFFNIFVSEDGDGLKGIIVIELFIDEQIFVVDVSYIFCFFFFADGEGVGLIFEVIVVGSFSLFVISFALLFDVQSIFYLLYLFFSECYLCLFSGGLNYRYMCNGVQLIAGSQLMFCWAF